MSKEKHEGHKAEEMQKTEPSDVVQIARTEYEALLQKIKDFSGLQEKMLRSAADFENAKKRLQKEKEEFSQYILEEFLHDIIPTLDNFERAFAHRNEANTGEKSIWSGIELVYKQLVDVLKGRGLTRMDAVGKPFDPHFHDAIAKVDAEAQREGLIAEEVLAGYFLNGKVIRHAKVKVYANPAAQEEKIEEIT